MTTHPYIPLFVDDFEAATAHLSLEEDGAYNRLIRLCWRTPGCSLPNDLAWIARKIRVSPEDFDRLVAPILAEFFKLIRGRYVQRRLKLEYDDISRKKSARQRAGKKGGSAKSQKTKEIGSSNATRLLGDTRAFPDPYPEPEGEEEPLLPAAGAERAIDLLGEGPVKGKVSRRKPETAIPDGYPDADAIAKGQTQSRAAGANLDAERLASRFRNHALQVDRRCRDWAAAWRNWVDKAVDEAPKRKGGPVTATPAAPSTFTGPERLRALVVAVKDEGFAVSWLDRCTWRAEGRTLIAPSQLAADTLQREVGRDLKAAHVKITSVEEEASGNLLPFPGDRRAAG